MSVLHKAQELIYNMRLPVLAGVLSELVVAADSYTKPYRVIHAARSFSNNSIHKCKAAAESCCFFKHFAFTHALLCQSTTTPVHS